MSATAGLIKRPQAQLTLAKGSSTPGPCFVLMAPILG